MPRSCFVPGCKSGCTSTRQRNKELGKRNVSLFSVPKKDELLEKWRKAVPSKDRVLSVSDKLCELHFTDECIARVHMTKIFDGSVFLIDRERACLKPGSVPTLFPILPTSVSSETSEKKPPSPSLPKYLSCETPERKQSISSLPADLSSETPEREQAVLSLPSYFSFEISESKPPLPSHPCHLSSKTSEKNPSTLNVLQQTKEPKVEVIPFHVNENINDSFQEEDKKEQFSYIQLMQHLEQVQKPNLWWTVSFCQDYIICTKWDNTWYNDRKVAVCQDLTTKIFIRNVQVPSLSMKIQNTESLSALLLKIDGLFICKCIESGNCSTCSGYISDDPSERKRRTWCTNCSIHRKRERDVERQRKLKLCAKRKKNFAQRMRNIMRQNTRLREKVVHLQEELKKSKATAYKNR